MKQFNTRVLVTTAILSAVAAALFYFEFPILSGLKADLSDFPVIIAGYSFGFWPALVVAVVKNLFHFLFIPTESPVVGELANFAYAMLIVLPFIVARKNKTLNRYIFSAITVLFAAFFMFWFNYFVIMPWYGIPDAQRMNLSLSLFLPFNIIKGSILVILFQLTRTQINSV